MVDLRVGSGFDIHRFASGRDLVLGGVKIPGAVGLLGYSDADVLCHAVMDALLGACGMSDIGHLFPPSEAKWQGAYSLELLEQVWLKVSAAGWAVVNIDCSLVLEAPKIAPYLAQIKENLARVLGGIGADRVGVKATTAERLGAIGREEGACCFAVVLLARSPKS